MLAEEIATYGHHFPQLLCEEAGRFVPITCADILGTFSDRPAALREGYRRFRVVPFLVRQIADPEPLVYLTRWRADRMPRLKMHIGEDRPIYRRNLPPASQ